MYYYDADGFRIEKSSGRCTGQNQTAVFYRKSDLAGNNTVEYDYLNGKRVARIDTPTTNPIVHYYFSDQVDFASLITDPSGNVQEKYYYYPYGAMQSSSGSDPNHYKFTGKERDAESGLDNFGKCYFGSSLGRFMTPDPPLMDQHIADPQS
jgi:RHS repeat-associated protein